MTQISDLLEKYSKEYNITLSPQMLKDFEAYASTLLEWNERINLTAITLPGEIAVKHFLDSILLLNAVDVPDNSSLIDVGTGAGFPAIPLKIVRRDICVTLLDSLNKRVLFLTELSRLLGQENTVIHGRAEELGRDVKLREKFDFATARGVAALPALCEYCLPFVKTGGIFAALKGPDIHAEAESSKKALEILGGEIAGIKHFDLPLNNKRAIVLIKKISQMPPKYPRTAVKITKKPL